MQNFNLNDFIQSHSRKASQRVLFVVLMFTYLLYIIFVTYGAVYRTKAIIEGNSDTLSQLISIGDLNRIRSITRSFISNGTSDAIWVSQVEPDYLIEYFAVKSLENYRNQDSKFFFIVKSNIYFVNNTPILLNDSTIGKIKTATNLPIHLYVFGLLALAVVYYISSFFLKREFRKVGEQLSDPLKTFYHYLKGNTQAIKNLNNLGQSYQEINEIYFEHSRLIEKIKQQQVLEEEARKNLAIAQTTQALAHDVRKPFTMIKGLLSMINATQDVSQLKKISDEYVSEVSQALMSVNSMISDIMEVGNETKLVSEPTKVQSLILSTLSENFRFNKRSDISFSFNLKHRYQVNVDPIKVMRVFSNITQNATHAMKLKGHIWIRTKEIFVSDKLFVEFCLGNNHSYIPSEDLSQIFDTFYTKNKRDGTGLGLAIAKKMILAHGGNIWCKSSPELGVEFYFTLPASSSIELFNLDKLPQHSSELLAQNNLIETNGADFMNREEMTSELLQLIHKVKTEIQLRNLDTIVIVSLDDEALYRHLIQEIFTETDHIKNYFKIKTYSNPHHAITDILEDYPLLTLLDIDLGDLGYSGFDVVKELRKRGFSNKICIHSNRGNFEFQKNVIESGADLMIPKPISKIQILSLMLSILKNLPEMDDKNSDIKVIKKNH